MAVGTPTTNTGNSTTPACGVPAGVGAGDVVLLAVSQDTAISTFTGKWPAGFTQLVDAAGTADGQRYGLAWKRLTGADSGSYTLAALGNSADWAATCVPLTGRHATNAPVISASSLNNTLTASPVTITANGLTAVAGDDILFVSLPDVNTLLVGNGHSAWTAGYTEIVDYESTVGWCNIGVAKAENVGAGATGTKTTTFTLTSGTSGSGAWLIAFPAAAGGTTQVSASRRVVYNVQAQVAASRRVVYGVRAQVAATRRVNYAVLAPVAASRRISYGVLAQVTATRRLVYAVLATVLATRRVTYNVLAPVSGSRRVVYSVTASTTQVAATRRITYGVTTQVAGLRRVNYAVGDPVVALGRYLALVWVGS